MKALVDVTGDELRVVVEGTFDPMGASALRSRLAGNARRVVLDFSRALEIHDLGLAVLAHGLAAEGIATRFRGLSPHHERLLRVLGLDLAGSGSLPEARRR